MGWLVPHLVRPLIISFDSQCVLWCLGWLVGLAVGLSFDWLVPQSVSPKVGVCLSVGWLMNQFLNPDQFTRLLVSPLVRRLLVWSLSWQVQVLQ